MSDSDIPVCPWCEKEGTRRALFYPAAGLSLHLCPRCGVWFSDDLHSHIDYTKYNCESVEDQGGRGAQTRKLDVHYGRNEQAKYLLQRFERAVGPSKARSFHVLDVGCGPGDLLAEIQHSYPHATLSGLDPSVHNVESACERHHLEIQQGFWEEGQVRHSTYDVILMFGNLMLHANPKESLEAASRCLSPGGFLVFDVKNPNSLTRTLLRKFKPLLPNHRHVRKLYRQAFHGMPWGLPQQAVERALRASGLEILSIRQLSGRNVESGRQVSWGMHVSGLLDRAMGRQAWIEFVARRSPLAGEECNLRGGNVER